MRACYTCQEPFYSILLSPMRRLCCPRSPTTRDVDSQLPDRRAAAFALTTMLLVDSRFIWIHLVQIGDFRADTFLRILLFTSLGFQGSLARSVVMVKNVLYYMAPTLDSAFIISASTLVIVTSPQEPRHCTTNVAPLHTMNDVLSRYIRSQSRCYTARIRLLVAGRH
jgi:hypothetical protein